MPKVNYKICGGKESLNIGGTTIYERDGDEVNISFDCGDIDFLVKDISLISDVISEARSTQFGKSKNRHNTE